MELFSESVTLEREGDIEVVAIDNPPVNALSHHVRSGLLAAMQHLDGSNATAGVLICRGNTFSAGADITGFGRGMEGAAIEKVQAAVENCSKPIVAAIHGSALGGGLEVALCAHYRVAVAGARFGLPEVNLGLLPGAGGTQRLPRVMGVATALDMVTSGPRIGAEEALGCGLIDTIVDDLWAGAVGYAREAVERSLPLTRIRDRRDKLDEAGPDLISVALELRWVDAGA